MKLPISLIAGRWLAVVALVLILAAFGGTWAGKGQTIPIETIPIEQEAQNRIWLPVIWRAE